MKLFRKSVTVCCAICLALGPFAVFAASNAVKLPTPSYTGKISVEAAMAAKHSVRSFKGVPLTLQQVSQLLWAGNGLLPSDAVTGATPKTIPSAGGLYPLELFIVTGKDTVKDLAAGVYQYDPFGNALKTVAQGDKRTALAGAALSQMWMARAPAVIVIAAVFSRTTMKYGSRGNNYVFMEAGNSNQNLYLQAEALGLGVGTVGAFNDAQVGSVLSLPASTAPLLLVPVGK